MFCGDDTAEWIFHSIRTAMQNVHTTLESSVLTTFSLRLSNPFFLTKIVTTVLVIALQNGISFNSHSSEECAYSLESSALATLG